MINIGDLAPAFNLPTDNEDILTLRAFKDRKLVLYFYPKDDTPGCTKQAVGFSARKAEFEAAGASILGVSKDSVAKHAKFRAKHDLTIPLGADEEGAAAEAYGVWTEKNMYGKKYMGIERSTFLINQKGIITAIWRKVRVAGHVDAVFDALVATD